MILGIIAVVFAIMFSDAFKLLGALFVIALPVILFVLLAGATIFR